VLLPIARGRPMRPARDTAFGRAAVALRGEGVRVVVGDVVRAGQMDGFDVGADGTWRPCRGVAVGAVYDRFTSQRDAARHAELLAQLVGVPVGNPDTVVRLCRDKLASQRALQSRVRMPEVVDDPDQLAAAVAGWGSAFLKPRHGAFGRGVRRVCAGEPVPHALEGTHGAPEPAIAQRAIAPPAGWAGVSVRVLAQRVPGGGWVLAPGAARRSHDDPVVNVSRGAEAVPADDLLGPSARAALREMILAGSEVLAAGPDGDRVVELGWDAVIDADGSPWIIEVNGRPRGRVEALAAAWPERFGAAHLAAALRPLRYLAALAAAG
jgi:glutathione synthase/RimK-type ligase-like ATP-grasp enzyme